MDDINKHITNYAMNILNLDAIGFTSAEIPMEDIINYREYLQKNYLKGMEWMSSRQELRENPHKLLQDVKSIIVVGANYHHKVSQPSKKGYNISVYANQEEDYHNWLYKKVRLLAEFIEKEYNTKQRHFVDSAPVLEKVFAKKTSIGWQGKHTCIVSRKYGSWLFLGVILTTLKLKEDTPHRNLCYNCDLCIKACPTGALSDYKLNTKKCISYLTIENNDEDLPEKLQNKFNNKQVFGCDECLKACPFNRWQNISKEEKTKEHPELINMIDNIENINNEDFKKITKNTPLFRTGLKKIIRNINFINKRK